MADFVPTPSQAAAIRATEQSILVSAGAGSGKTAVLAERCAHLVADVTPPCSVDSLLVVTFTDAATAQMRFRIEKALRDRLNRDSTNRCLQEQIALLDTASIFTIHGFCRRVLNRYFAQADLDPQTPLLDPQDAELLRRETAQGALDRFADAEGPEGDAMCDLLARYAGPNEQRLIDAALAVHAFLASIPDPDEWLTSSLKRLASDNSLVAPFWIEIFARNLKTELRDQVQMLADFVAVLERESHSFTFEFTECIDQYRQQIKRWQTQLPQAPDLTELDSVCAEIAVYNFPKTPRSPRHLDSVIKPAFERCQLHVKAVRDDLYRGRLKKNYGSFRSDKALTGIIQTTPHIQTFVKLVDAITRDYQAAKRSQGVVDFADLERMTLTLLRDESNGAARRLRDKYRVIMVDEFQDVNPVQAEILQLVSREEDPARRANLFTVGDVKQSIYRFRLAEPRLFVDRQDQFPSFENAPADAREVRIALRENFRSRPGVIDVINRICDRLIAADLGGIDYNDQARLIATKPAASTHSPPLELHLLAQPPRSSESDSEPRPDDAMDWEQVEREAYVIAGRIQKLIAEGRRYSNIVILLRSLQARAGLFIRTLVRQGIPVFSESAGGIFESLEIMDVLSLLQLLDNGNQDIPLASILRSPLVQPPLNDDDMAEIRIASRRIDRDMPYYEAARWYAREGPREPLRKSLAGLFEKLDKWRQRIRRRPLADVLWEILDETGYLSYVSGLREGRQRRANLLRFHEYARQFGTFSRQGLCRFLRFVEALADSDQDLEPGSVSASSQDVVRLMSIHKSKGLEFPIVIVAELGKRFNLTDAHCSILYDRKLGLAFEAVDLEKRIRYSTLPHQLVRQVATTESRGEELRILYVALTRAEERLILVGTGDLDQFTQARTQYSAHTGPLPLLARQTAQCFQDWIIDAIACQDEKTVSVNQPSTDSTMFAITTYPLETMKEWTLDPPDAPETIDMLERFANLEAVPHANLPKVSGEVVDKVSRRLTTSYPAAVLGRIPSVIAASELKRRWNTSADAVEAAAELPQATKNPNFSHARSFAIPEFLRTGDLPEPTQRGTWTHEFLQHVDFAKCTSVEHLREQLTALINGGRFESNIAAHIDLDALAWFFTTDLAKRLCSAGKVLREWPFVLGVEPAKIEPVAQSVATPQDVVLVRGIIDCLFDAGEGWEILDYKTDAVDDVTDRVVEYRGQLDIYASAVEATWGATVKRRWLVFLHPRKIVELAPGKVEST